MYAVHMMNIANEVNILCTIIGIDLKFLFFLIFFL